MKYLDLVKEDEKLPITYAYEDEINSFYASDNESIIGYSYEWEQEQVVHIHTHKLGHSHGIVTKCLFTKAKPDDAMSTNSQILKDEGYGRVVYINKSNLNITVDCFDVETQVYISVNIVPSQDNLYSRSKGLLEVDVLKDKRVAIIGLGSFGAPIAIELAKAGVGSFALFDFDRVELHNLARHTCVINDLGRLKTDAIYDAIKGKNPYATIDKFPININKNLELLETEVAKADIIICATDNNQSRFNLSTILVNQKKIGVFGRAVTRAEGGDVFRYRPEGPCYCCLIGNGWFDQGAEEITDVRSARKNGQIAAYVSEEDANAIVQVGLSTDIEPIYNLMVKLVLMELSRGTNSGISSLEEELVYDYYMWANRRERRHANWAAMPMAGNKPTILRWYGARIERDDNCALCSSNMVLDEGAEYEGNYVIATDESFVIDENL